jgi:hypothetical protein
MLSPVFDSSLEGMKGSAKNVLYYCTIHKKTSLLKLDDHECSFQHKFQIMHPLHL